MSPLIAEPLTGRRCGNENARRKGADHEVDRVEKVALQALAWSRDVPACINDGKAKQPLAQAATEEKLGNDEPREHAEDHGESREASHCEHAFVIWGGEVEAPDQTRDGGKPVVD